MTFLYYDIECIFDLSMFDNINDFYNEQFYLENSRIRKLCM